MANTHVQITRLQNQIRDHLGLSPDEAYFDYKEGEDGVTLDLITINPQHNQSFLFHSVAGKAKVDALEAMVAYVQNYREKENSFTIQWAIRGTSHLHTSYFRGKDVYDVLRKFEYGRDRNTVVIYSISLNPVA